MGITQRRDLRRAVTLVATGIVLALWQGEALAVDEPVDATGTVETAVEETTATAETATAEATGTAEDATSDATETIDAAADSTEDQVAEAPDAGAAIEGPVETMETVTSPNTTENSNAGENDDGTNAQAESTAPVETGSDDATRVGESKTGSSRAATTASASKDPVDNKQKAPKEPDVELEALIDAGDYVEGVAVLGELIRSTASRVEDDAQESAAGAGLAFTGAELKQLVAISLLLIGLGMLAASARTTGGTHAPSRTRSNAVHLPIA